jgi:hypothetical protein
MAIRKIIEIKLRMRKAFISIFLPAYGNPRNMSNSQRLIVFTVATPTKASYILRGNDLFRYNLSGAENVTSFDKKTTIEDEFPSVKGLIVRPIDAVSVSSNGYTVFFVSGTTVVVTGASGGNGIVTTLQAIMPGLPASATKIDAMFSPDEDTRYAVAGTTVLVANTKAKKVDSRSMTTMFDHFPENVDSWFSPIFPIAIETKPYFMLTQGFNAFKYNVSDPPAKDATKRTFVLYENKSLQDYYDLTPLSSVTPSGPWSMWQIALLVVVILALIGLAVYFFT